MKYHCTQCNLHFDYPKRDSQGREVCPSCKAPVEPFSVTDDYVPAPASSPWTTVAAVILVADIVAAIIVAVRMPDPYVIGACVAEVAMVALLCGIVMLLAKIEKHLRP